VAEPTAQKQIH